MRQGWIALGLIATSACSRTSLDAPAEPLQTQPTCTAAIVPSCQGLRVLTPNAPFDGPIPNSHMVSRNGGYEWFDWQTSEVSRLALAGSPPLLHEEQTAPIDQTGIDGWFDDIATDGTHLFGCTRGRHNQLWAYDGSNALTTMLDFSESADNPCSVSAFGNVALVTYDVFDAQGERSVLANDHGFVFSKETGANPFTGSYSCGFFTWVGSWGGGGYNQSSVSMTTIPMDGGHQHTFELPLAEPGEPTFSTWPYADRSIAMVWRADSGDPTNFPPNNECNVHLVVVTDDGQTTIDRTFPSQCAAGWGPNGQWLPHVLVAGFGPVLDWGNGQLQLLGPNGDLVGPAVTLALASSSDPNRIAENDLWSVADNSYVIAIVFQFFGGPGSQALQSILTCE